MRIILQSNHDYTAQKDGVKSTNYRLTLEKETSSFEYAVTLADLKRLSSEIIAFVKEEERLLSKVTHKPTGGTENE